MRYYAPDGFVVPERLAGMDREYSHPNPHVDRYYDAPAQGGGLLRALGASIRVRVKHNGLVLATYKVKLTDEGVSSRREETEDAVRCARCEAPAASCTCGQCSTADNYAQMVNAAHSGALDAARTMSACRPFVYLFAIINDRVDHHFRAGDAHVVLSEDAITYPDGSTERRVEVEHVTGDPAQLDAIDAQLRALYPGIQAVKRGKLSEGRRRLAALLAG